MRLDHTLYSVGVVFLLVTVVSATLLSGTSRTLSMVLSGIIGLAFLGFGFLQRPKATTPAPTMLPTPVTSTPIEPSNEKTLPLPSPEPVAQVTTAVTVEQPEPQVTAVVQEAPVPIAPMEASAQSPLTQVSGIGEKRATQLNALGIHTVEDLANASIEDVAARLKVSPKIVAKWVTAAKTLTQK